MPTDLTAVDVRALVKRNQELEARIGESEEMLDALRRGDIDSLVISGAPDEHRVYTLESGARPYQVLIEQMQEGAVTLGADGTVLYCNRRLANMLEVPSRRVMGQRLQDFLLPDETVAFDELLDAAKYARARGEFTLRRADAPDTPIYVSLTTLDRDRGGLLLCGVLTDLTEQKLIEATLQAAIAERGLRRVQADLARGLRLESMAVMAAGLAHELNQPLAAAANFLSAVDSLLLKSEAADADASPSISADNLAMARAGVAEASDQVLRAGEIVRRLRDFIGRGDTEMREEELGPLIKVACFEALASLDDAATSAISMQVDVPDDLGTSLVDRIQLRQVLANLVRNAAEAMRGAAECRRQEIIVSAFRALDGGCEIAVADTGPGIKAAEQERLFHAFSSKKAGGMGVGLAICRTIVESHGGRLWFADNPIGGAKFCLSLPPPPQTTDL